VDSQPPKSNPVLSVIVPAYRCPTIVHDLEAIDQYLQALNIPYELICVVDGVADKQDTTAKIAPKATKFGVQVYSYPENQGKGYAIRYGMARARGTLIAFIDAGSDLNARGLGLALEHLKWYEADIIIGSKRHKASKINYPFNRRILSWIVQRATRFIFGFNVSDTQTGLKLFRREVLDDVLPRLLVKRWAFDIEILAVAHRLGYTQIYESPIELQFNNMSTLNYRSVINFAIDYLAIIYRIYILKYYNNSHQTDWEQDPNLTLKTKSPIKKSLPAKT